MKNYLKIAGSFLLIALFAAAITFMYGTPYFPTLTGVAIASTVLSFAPMPEGIFKGVVLEQWAAYIIKRFWKDNAFLKNSYDDTQYVMSGRIVHIPQPGAKPTVVKNRSSYPAAAVRRTDTDVLYSLDEYSTDPTHIPNIDSIHLSYSKQDSVLGEHMSVLDETVADDLLIKWAGNATMFKTNGGDASLTATSTSGAQVGPVTGQTGNRLGLHPKDLSRLMVQMNVNNVPKEGRFILIDDNMYEFFYNSLSDNQVAAFLKLMDLENGVVGGLHGFKIGTRSSVLASNSSDAIKALGSSLAATDNLASIAWHKDSVAAAIGDTKLFQDQNNPLYYGDVHSALVMAGGRVRRGDGLGVYTIAQGAVRS